MAKLYRFTGTYYGEVVVDDDVDEMEVRQLAANAIHDDLFQVIVKSDDVIDLLALDVEPGEDTEKEPT